MNDAERMELAEARTQDDGRFAFRLLSVTLPDLDLPGGAHVRMTDIIEALVRGPSGRMSERPVATVRVEIGRAHV